MEAECLLPTLLPGNELDMREHINAMDVEIDEITATSSTPTKSKYSSFRQQIDIMIENNESLKNSSVLICRGVATRLPSNPNTLPTPINAQHSIVGPHNK